MPDHSSQALDDRTHHVARTDWRLGGRTVRGWGAGLLGIALISLGVSIVLGALLQLIWRSPWAAASATGVVIVGMLVPIVLALRTSRPAGLLRFRALDLLFGVAFGVLLRFVQGFVETAVDGPAPLPSYGLIDGRLPATWVIAEVVVPVGVAPVVEEFFFRAVLLIGIYSLLRRAIGPSAAGTVAVLTSTGVFVLAHTLAGETGIDAVISTALLGLVCGLIVIFTGRIWGAVLTHFVFNATWVALTIAGTVLR